MMHGPINIRYIYIYIYVCVCVCVCEGGILNWLLSCELDFQSAYCGLLAGGHTSRRNVLTPSSALHAGDSVQNIPPLTFRVKPSCLTA